MGAGEKTICSARSKGPDCRLCAVPTRTTRKVVTTMPARHAALGRNASRLSDDDTLIPTTSSDSSIHYITIRSLFSTIICRVITLILAYNVHLGTNSHNSRQSWRGRPAHGRDGAHAEQSPRSPRMNESCMKESCENKKHITPAMARKAKGAKTGCRQRCLEVVNGTTMARSPSRRSAHCGEV